MNKIRKIVNLYNNLPLAIKASFWFLICSFFQKGISVITTPIFTRLLTTDEYGAYNVFESWHGIVSIFVSLNLSAGVFVQGLVKFDSDKLSFSSSIHGLTFTLSLIWTIVYVVFRSFFNNLFSLTTTQMLAMLLMIWTTSVFNLWSARQRVDLKYKCLIAVTIIVSLMKPALGIFGVLHFDDKVTARILGLALAELICFSCFFFVELFRGKSFFSKKYWLYALSFNIPLIPHYLSQIVLSSSDRIMIGRMVDDSSAGIYSLAYSIASLMVIFNTALLFTITPNIYKKIKDNKVDDINGFAIPSLFLIAAVNILLIALAPEAVAIFGTADYYQAIYVIPPIAMSVFFMYLYNLFAAFEFYYKKTLLISVASIFGAALNILLNFLFIPLFGFYAAGYTTLICYFVYAGMHFMFMSLISKKQYNKKSIYNLKQLFLIAIFFIGISFVFLFSYRHTWLRIGLFVNLIFICFVFKKKIFGIIGGFLPNRERKTNVEES